MGGPNRTQRALLLTVGALFCLALILALIYFALHLDKRRRRRRDPFSDLRGKDFGQRQFSAIERQDSENNNVEYGRKGGFFGGMLRQFSSNKYNSRAMSVLEEEVEPEEGDTLI